ncbi:MAG TPA: hypothetical protein VLT15_05230 [Acidimicrobiia bacterium]|nr:hypothetical protein [Acidimicrobiia bacterium]
MNFSIEPWAPDYGVAVSADMDETTAPPSLDVEVPAADWAPIQPSGRAAESVLFVDGVRRIDANVWIAEPEGTATLGICASYAAGAVRADGSAEVVEAVVERGLFSSAGRAEDIATVHTTYAARSAAGETPEALWLALQQRMGELENAVVTKHEGADLVVADGPLRAGRHVPSSVGYIKTHHVHYLPPAVRPILGSLDAGQRTPIFLSTTSWSRFMWYLRLPGPAGHPLASVVRLETSADQSPAAAAALADLVSSSLPRFASHGHKDPRAPQNLYPIAGLERELRRRLGDPRLLYRDLRAAAAMA